MEFWNTLLTCLFGLLTFALGARVANQSSREAQLREHEIQRERDRAERAHRDKLERSKAYKEWFEAFEGYYQRSHALAAAAQLLGAQDQAAQQRLGQTTEEFSAAHRRFSASSNYLLAIETRTEARALIRTVQDHAAPDLSAPSSDHKSGIDRALLQLGASADYQTKAANALQAVQTLVETIRLDEDEGPG